MENNRVVNPIDYVVVVDVVFCLAVWACAVVEQSVAAVGAVAKVISIAPHVEDGQCEIP